MSLGFSAGDFIAIGRLTMDLYRSLKNAPSEFAEVSRELSSINLVIADIKDQASTPSSLLNRRGASRKEEFLAMIDNLTTTLIELQDIYQKYRNMGRNAWLRVQLGEEDLADLRSRLDLHFTLVNGFMTSLTMAGVGRMEPMMVQVLEILKGMARGEGGGAKSLVEAQEVDAGDEAWVALEKGLCDEGIPEEFLRRNEDDIRTLVGELRDEETLDDISPDDSASQIWKQPPAYTDAKQQHLVTETVKASTSDTFAEPTSFTLRETNLMLRDYPEEEIREATRRLLNNGYDLSKVTPPSPKPTQVPPSPSFSFRQKIWPGSSAKAALARVKLEQQELEDRNLEQMRYNAKVLHDSARRCDVLAALLVLQKSVDINITLPSENEGTPIFSAISSNKTDLETEKMVRTFVRLGGNYRSAESSSQLPNLFAAVLASKMATVEFLVSQGADVKESVRFEDSVRITALHLAARSLHAPTVKLLLENGADVNAKYSPIRRPHISFTPLDDCYKNDGVGSDVERVLKEAGGMAVQRWPSVVIAGVEERNGRIREHRAMRKMSRAQRKGTLVGKEFADSGIGLRPGQSESVSDLEAKKTGTEGTEKARGPL